MNPKRYERLREIFFKACDLELAERQAFLKDACADDPTLLGELGALFHADTASGGLLGDAAITDDMRIRFKETLDSIQTVTWPDHIGKYTIIRKISDGGMGTVFEAEQENPQRKVALKVIRVGATSEETLRRFELEADLLALLQHPGIAQIFETGTADTGMGLQPYLAMELVEGKTITEYVKDNNLSLKQRLKLLATVCEAVHHAHQKGVVHRDLKPANILVDESGQSKILDFGVARATDQDIKTTTIQTEVGQLIGTLAYMSPEQAAGDSREIDIRSDVYSLGVIAFELLSGNMPYEVSKKMVHEAVRVIQEDEPTCLSSVVRELRGDVDTIVAKALAKDKERRYQSASGLSSDIYRYLNDEPITARPPSAIYQLSKFTRRNKVLVGGITATFLMLLLGIAGTGYGLIEAKFNEREAKLNEQVAIAAQREVDIQREISGAFMLQNRNFIIREDNRQRKIAEATKLLDAAQVESDKAFAISQFFETLLKEPDPYKAPGIDVAVNELLFSVVDKMDDEPEARATIINSIGVAYLNLGEFEKALPFLLQALELRNKHLGESHKYTVDTLQSIERYQKNSEQQSGGN